MKPMRPRADPARGQVRIDRAMIARCRTLEELAELFERGGSSPVAALVAAKRTLEARELRAREGKSFMRKYRRVRRRD